MCCREGKTDYYARKRLITQAKNRYATPKYRLVVRFTNTTVVRFLPLIQNVVSNIIIRFVKSSILNFRVILSLHQHIPLNLPKYGIKHGLKNWAAAYATGLLVARRALTKIGLAEQYEGVVEPDGSHTLTEAADKLVVHLKSFSTLD